MDDTPRRLGELEAAGEPMATPGASPASKPEALDLGAAHIRAAGAALVARLDRLARNEAGTEAPFPWPGNPKAPLDADDDARTPAPRGALTRGRRPVAWPSTRGAVGVLDVGSVAVLVGPPGRGKSAWALAVAEAVAVARRPVLYVSAELDAPELVARLLSLRSYGCGPAGGFPPGGVAWSGILAGRVPPDELGAALEGLVTEAPFLYLWCPLGRDRNPDRLDLAARELVRLHPEAGPPLVVVDYLQRLAPAGSGDRRLDVAGVSEAFRTLARPRAGWAGAAVLLLSSAARTHYATRGDARDASKGGVLASTEALRDADPSDIMGTGKESGDIEYDAPVVLGMTADTGEPGARCTVALLRVAKRRDGPAGGAVWYDFHKALGAFVERTAPAKPEKPEKPVSRTAKGRRDDFDGMGGK